MFFCVGMCVSLGAPRALFYTHVYTCVRVHARVDARVCARVRRL
jgi:hypothetical protein